MSRAAWTVIIAACATVSLALGARQTFGLFLLPLATEHGISATALGGAVALHNLMWGLAQPLTGAMADRHGAGRVAAAGALFYCVGLGLPTLAPTGLAVVIGIGLLCGVGVACAGTGIALAAVGRAVPPAKRAEAIGISSAGGSVGQAAMVPLAAVAIAAWGSTGALFLLSAVTLLALPAAMRMEWRAPAPDGLRTASVGMRGLPRLARRALAERDFALLTLGFFACGFQLAFLTVHLPTHLALCGLPAGMGATALMLIGLFNIPGSWFCGRLGGWVRPELALGWIYLIRTAAIAVFAATEPTSWGALLFAAVMGTTWLGTVPLTSAAVARRFGVADLGALYGVCFFSHQIGGFIGAGAGAILLDTTGSYAAFWPVMVTVGAAAVALNWATRAPEGRAIIA
jgi:predicted MFS family arabinose efflux permease